MKGQKEGVKATPYRERTRSQQLHLFLKWSFFLRFASQGVVIRSLKACWSDGTV